MTEEIQCTRPKHLLHEFPEDQEHQRALFVFFLALNVIILVWKQDTILIPQFGWNFLCLMHILVCRGRCLSLCHTARSPVTGNNHCYHGHLYTDSFLTCSAHQG